jgi:hypothetical protein
MNSLTTTAKSERALEAKTRRVSTGAEEPPLQREHTRPLVDARETALQWHYAASHADAAIAPHRDGRASQSSRRHSGVSSLLKRRRLEART